MPKFNVTGRKAAPAEGPLTVQPDTEHINHQGGVGYRRDDKSDVFLLATTSPDLTASAYYERGDARVKRFTDLIAKTAVADPDWTFQFLSWLRGPGNIRTAAVVGGVEAARAMAAAGIPGGRHVVSAVLQRPDEPGEAIAYHHAVHGRRLSQPVKRGVADAATRLYNEWSLLKYDTASHGVRFADVLAMTHPTPAADKPWQADLFSYAIDRRYGRGDGLANISPSLATVRHNFVLRKMWADGDSSVADLADRLRRSGMTWEDVLSALGNKVDKADLWRALIPSMPFMARLRNLRNFDEAGLTDADVRPVLDMLADPGQVRKSRQLPLRFLSAYRAAPSLRWGHALDQALTTSVENIPALGGRTLILVDTSGSMSEVLSDRSELKRWDAAVSFGLAVARRCHEADVVSYSNGWMGQPASREFPTVRGESLLTSITRWQNGGYFIGGGTDTAGALKRHYAGHDRVVLLTDEQDGGFLHHHSTVPGKVSDQMPADRLLVTFNLAGYESSHAATNRYRLTLGGLTDQMFSVIGRVEQSYPGGWPWSGDPAFGPLPTYSQPVAAVTR